MAEGAVSRPVAVADALLATAVQPSVLAILIEPSVAGHLVTVETVDAVDAGLVLDADVGDAAIFRIALVASLDVLSSAQQIGRVQLRLGPTVGEVYVMVMRVSQGLSAEIRRVVRPSAAAAERGRPPEAGDRVGPYRLLAKIGDGGMGEVFRAEHEALGRQMAVKIMHRASRSASWAASLLSEGRLAARARSAGIVDVTDYGLTEGHPYLVMELVEWPTLDTVLLDGPFEPRRAVAVARQMLDALDAAHRQGVVHRDLKPANVFVGPQNAVKIGDFGIARALDERDPAEVAPVRFVTGSPPYMSPEHARGFATDARSDLYSVGCLLFEMLAGHCPYEGADKNEIMVKHVVDEIPTPTTPAGPIARALAAVVRRALAKDPAVRYQNARQMIAALDEAGAALQGGWKRWLNPA
jgi:serine/threonine protein kinase